MTVTEDYINGLQNYIELVTGQVVGDGTIVLAQLMVEIYCGRTRAEVTSARDLELMDKATIFQAIYITGMDKDVLRGTALRRQAQDDGVSRSETHTDGSKTEDRSDKTSKEYDDSFDEFIAPWAKQAMAKLSWRSTRTIRPVGQSREPVFTDWSVN